MAREMLYPDENPMVKRHSSIDQFREFLSVMTKGGWTPIVFDQLDGITCETIKSHPVIISFGDDIGYVFPEAHCSYASDKFVYFDKDGVEHKLLPECMGGKGEFFDYYFKGFSFVNFDNGTSVGVHSNNQLRVGLDYSLSDETLPAE